MTLLVKTARVPEKVRGFAPRKSVHKQHTTLKRA